MVASWYPKAKQFQSPTYVVAAFLLRSRETQVAINRRRQAQMKELNERLEQQAQTAQRQQQEIDTLRQQVTDLQKQLQEAKQSVNLPEDPPVGTHGYGARMISLAANLAKSIGLRGAERVLELLFEWLGIDGTTPSRTVIRNGLQRLDLYVIKQGAELPQPPKPHEDLVIMVDHSMQIGTEKVMVALGVNASRMPEPGEALTRT